MRTQEIYTLFGRGIGTLEVGLPVGCAGEIDAEQLLSVVEQSMSSEIYELMKRADEAAVVDARTATRASSRTAHAG